MYLTFSSWCSEDGGELWCPSAFLHLLFTPPVLPLYLMAAWFLASCEGSGSESSTSEVFERKMRDAQNRDLGYFWATQLPLPYKHFIEALLVTLKELTVSPSDWTCLFRTRLSGQDLVASYPSHDHSVFHEKETLLPIILYLFCIRVCPVS